MQKFSLTISGILVMVVGTFLVESIGISEACSGEIQVKISQYLPLVGGAVMAWIGRIRKGDVTNLGFKKTIT